MAISGGGVRSPWANDEDEGRADAAHEVSSYQEQRIQMRRDPLKVEEIKIRKGGLPAGQKDGHEESVS
jgi:hypothetical protein